MSLSAKLLCWKERWNRGTLKSPKWVPFWLRDVAELTRGYPAQKPNRVGRRG